MLVTWKKLLATWLIMACGMTTSAVAAEIHLTIDGVRNAHGSVYVLLFDNPAAFAQIDTNRAIDFAEIRARPGKLTHVFSGLDTGPFAIMLFHDENGDGDFNMAGEQALEGYGLSGSKGKDDFPDFQNASFPPGAVSVKVHYIK